MEKEELLFRKRLRELSELSYERDIPTHTDFLSLDEQTIFRNISATLPPVKVSLTGGSPMSERKVLCFLPSYEEEPSELPFVCLHIMPVNPKFAESLTHRDYLGAIMNLGIERSTTGDIIVKDGGAFVFVLRKIAVYLKESLTTVKRTPVRVTVCEDAGELVVPEFDVIEGTVSSLRLDSVTALCGRLSRSKSVTLIEGESVQINGRVCTLPSKAVEEGDVLSLRGIGKFRLKEKGTLTKKGRIVVTVLKYK